MSNKNKLDQGVIERINENTLKRYNARIKEHRYGIKALGWGAKEQQQYRFEQVIKNNALTDKTLIDFGCGYGDFALFLKEKHIAYKSYTGIDINKQFISEAKKRHTDDTFLYIENENEGLEVSAEFVLMLGLLNYNHSEVDNLEYSRHMLSKVRNLATSSICCDFISAIRTSEYEQEGWIYSYQPSDVMALALELSSNFRLDHSYAPIPLKEMLLTIDL